MKISTNVNQRKPCALRVLCELVQAIDNKRISVDAQKEGEITPAQAKVRQAEILRKKRKNVIN